jgi:hypothetical protein
VELLRACMHAAETAAGRTQPAGNQLSFAQVDGKRRLEREREMLRRHGIERCMVHCIACMYSLSLFLSLSAFQTFLVFSRSTTVLGAN